jgi:hypothetical protein
MSPNSSDNSRGSISSEGNTFRLILFSCTYTVGTGALACAKQLHRESNNSHLQVVPSKTIDVSSPSHTYQYISMFWYLCTEKMLKFVLYSFLQLINYLGDNELVYFRNRYKNETTLKQGIYSIVTSQTSTRYSISSHVRRNLLIHIGYD